MKHLVKHIPHYLSLLGILAIGIFGFITFSHDSLFQAAIVVGIAVSYVVWGIVHHLIHEDLHTSVIIEYILIAALGLVIVFSLILNT